MRVLIFNQKGGCGKTTTAINLGAALARLGDAPVTLVDLDPQTHLTAALGRRAEGQAWSVTQWLAGKPGSALPVSERLFLVPGDSEAQETPVIVNPLGGMEGIVLIDAPPVWSFTVARLVRDCDAILTPLEPDYLGLQGFNRLLRTLKTRGVPWSRLRILICRYVDRLSVHREVRERLGQLFNNGGLLPVVIRNSVRLAEAPGFGLHIFDHAPDSAGACDYEAAARLLLVEWRGLSGPAEIPLRRAS
jgi:chromosome partitioning protein